MLLQKSAEEFQALGAAHTAAEIVQQPKLWQKLLQDLSEKKAAIQSFLQSYISDNTKVIFCGAGSSEFVGNTVLPYLKSLGVRNVNSISSTDIVLAPKSYIYSTDKILLVSCARSGGSPESIAAARLVEQIAETCHHLILTCNMAGNLAHEYQERSDAYVLHIDGANDQGFAMTGSFTCMTLAAGLVFQLQQIDLFQQHMAKWTVTVEAYMEQVSLAMAERAELRKSRVICLGSAENKGIAQEAHLKILELSSSHSIASFDSPLGFRHGPKSILNDESIIFFFCSSDPYTLAYELDMLRELMTDQGKYQVVVISPQPLPNSADRDALSHCTIIHPENPFPGSPGKILSSLLHILTAQIYALQNSLNLGVKPDDPSPSGVLNRVVQGVEIYPYQH